MKLPLANIITLSRVVLFVFFVWQASRHHILPAVVLFALAWGLDAVDGYVARARGEASEFGSLLDKVVDRSMLVLGGVVLGSLRLVPDMAFFLFVKDFAIAPALTIAWWNNKQLSGAGAVGKAVTFLQGLGIIWLLLGWPYPLLIVVPTAGLGAYMAWKYLAVAAK